MGTEIKIRPFVWKSDYKALLQIVYDSWFFEDSPLIGHLSAARFTLHSVLQGTTCLVAESSSGQVMGFLALDNKVDKPQLKASTFEYLQCEALEKFAFCSLYLLPKAKISRLFSDLFEINYKKLRRLAPHPDWPEFVLLIVSPHAKRMGIGRKLIAAGEEALKKQSFKNYYLLTDSSCDYQFYERLKMRRVVDVAMDFTLRHIENYNYYLNTYLHCYIYEATLNSELQQP